MNSPAASTGNRLAGKTVLVCRPRSQAAELLEALAAEGAETVSLPLIEIVEPADGGAALEDGLATLDFYDWITFTSANAVYSVIEHQTAAERTLAFDKPKVAAVGARTAKLLKDSGYRVHFVSEAGNAADLAATLPADDGQRVLAPLGDKANAVLTDGLEARGLRVDRVEAYRTLWANVSDASVTKATEADVVVLTSPSIAERVAELMGVNAPPSVCIGPATTAAAATLRLNVAGVAKEPSTVGLVEAVAKAIAK